MDTLHCLIEAHCQLAEGPFWWHNRLWWLDITPGVLHRCNHDGDEHETWALGEPTGTAVPSTDGGLVLGQKTGLKRLHLTDDGPRITPICDPEADRPDNRFNDGKVDPRGRFWAGTMSIPREPEQAALYRLDPDSSCHTVIKPVSLSNGLDWSPDERWFYYIDTPTACIRRYPYDAERGELGEGTVLACFDKDQGHPDGCCMDREGNLWVAFFHGGCIRHVHGTSGEVLEEVRMPVPNVSSCCFGDEGYNRLFITTAGGNSDHACAGGIFVYEPKPGGLSTREWRGE